MKCNLLLTLSAALLGLATQTGAHDLTNQTAAGLDLADFLTLTSETPTSATYGCPDCESEIVFTVEKFPADDDGLATVNELLSRDSVFGAPLELIQNDCADRGCGVSLETASGPTLILEIRFDPEDDPESDIKRIIRFAKHDDTILKLTLASPTPSAISYLEIVTRQNLLALIEDPHGD